MSLDRNGSDLADEAIPSKTLVDTTRRASTMIKWSGKDTLSQYSTTNFEGKRSALVDVKQLGATRWRVGTLDTNFRPRSGNSCYSSEARLCVPERLPSAEQLEQAKELERRQEEVDDAVQRSRLRLEEERKRSEAERHIHGSLQASRFRGSTAYKGSRF